MAAGRGPEGGAPRRGAALGGDASRSPPLGEPLARRLCERLWTSAEGTGLIHAHHRDYCGHGLIRTTEGVKLCGIEDGHFHGPAIAAWDDREVFVAFFARQSDWSCSGSEPAEPVFYTEDDWDRCNQRLTRGAIEAFCGLV